MASRSEVADCKQQNTATRKWRKKKTCRGPAQSVDTRSQKVFLDARGHAASHHSSMNSSATERCACLVECFHSYGVHSLIFLNRNNIAAQDFYITKIV